MRNNAAYLPESPIVYIILPKSIRNRASFGIFVLSVLVGIAIIFFAIALTWLLGLALGSVLLAVILMGGLFLLLALIVYLLRKKLIINPSVRLLSAMVDNMSQKHSDYGKES